ncbi:MAG: hypothetical protein H8D35_00180 [Nitrosopumilus sp.]|nr:hypothetical protein [Nitrosopumilus sp.]
MIHNCTHQDTGVRITFDVGYDKTSVYDLCDACRKLPVFTENILYVKEIKK